MTVSHHCLIPVGPNYSLLTVLLWFSVASFGVRVSVKSHIMFVNIILVRFRLLSDHLLGKSCSLDGSYVVFVF